MDYSKLLEGEFNKATRGILPEWYNSEGDGWYEYINGLPVNLQLTYLIIVLDAQVINGGFDQYFVNGYGQFAKMTIPALIEIGAYRKAELLKQALLLVNSNNYSDDVFRRKIQKKKISSLFNDEELQDSLDGLDDEYYALDDENIDEFLWKYLESRQ